MTPRAHIFALALSTALGSAALAAPSRASAESAEEESGGGAYWYASFLGGAALPTGPMSEGRKEGLATTTRFGFTAENGLGFAINAEYSPLPHQAMNRATTVQSHLGLLSAAPRFTLGHGTFRIWLGAGGGVALERTTITRGGIAEQSEFAAEPLALGEAGVEFHVFDSGGLTVSGGYARSFGEEMDVHLASVQGGLVFTFQ